MAPLKKILLTMGLSVMLALPVSASDFPVECEIDQREKAEAKFERYALGTVNSVLDACAFGDRIASAAQGILNDVFNRITSMIPDFADQDFFCGWGTSDIWDIANEGTTFEGSSNYRSWRRSHIDQLRRDTLGTGPNRSGTTPPWGSQGGQDGRPGRSSNASPDNVFDRIFNPSNQQENRNQN